MQLCLSICLSPASQFYIETAAQIELFFKHTSFPQLMLHCVIRKFRYIENMGAFPRNFDVCPELSRFFCLSAWHIDHCKNIIDFVWLMTVSSSSLFTTWRKWYCTVLSAAAETCAGDCASADNCCIGFHFGAGARLDWRTIASIVRRLHCLGHQASSTATQRGSFHRLLRYIA